MKFNPKARLDRSRVRRRGGSGGGARLPMGGGSSGGGGLPIPAGGGLVGIILVVVILVIATQCSGGGFLSGGAGDDSASQPSEDCNEQAAEDDLSQRCKIEYSVNSISEFWEDALPAKAGIEYQEAVTYEFTGGVSTGCGQASSAMGPFYCPPDMGVYLDLTFFDDMLEGQLGASGGDFAEAYVIAHEYGHHIQNLTGVLARAQSRETGPTSPGVRVELQADCYAGVWANHATTVEDDEGNVLITELTDDDIARAQDAAAAVGDDRIQQQTQGRVNPEQWTHGSAESRMRWFQRGFETGQMSACDTFATDDL